MCPTQINPLNPIFFFCFLGQSDAQELFLALHSGITAGGAWGTMWDAGNQTRVGCMQGQCPIHCAITPAPPESHFVLQNIAKVFPEYTVRSNP